jgi:type IV pilus assembly protein PilM
MATFVGLDLGTSAVRAVQLTTQRRDVPVLERIGQVPLPPGALSDGEITDPEAVASAIRLLWKTFNFKSRKVALGLANQQVVVRPVDLPYLPEAELRQSLALQVQDYVPIPIEQAVLDVHVVGNIETEDGQRITRVLLVAAQHAMVSAFVEVVRMAKLEPVGLDLNVFAVLRALADEHPLPVEEDSELLVDVGAAVTNLVVHQAGRPRFVRILPFGGSVITDGLMTGLGLSAEDAEDAKARIGISDDYLVALSDERARIISDGATRLVEEIRSSFDYFQAQEGSAPVRSAVLVGGASLLPNLPARLSEALGVPVELGRPVERLKVGKVGVPTEELARVEPFFAVAVGLARGVAA